MDKNTSRLMAIAVVALFCFSAIAVIVASDDDSSAASSTHKMYIETINASGINTKSQWITFDFDGTAADYAVKANEAVKRYGYDNLAVSYTGGDYISFDYPAGNVGVWYVKDNVWTFTNKTAQQLPSSNATALMLGGWISDALYDSLTDANKAKYDTSQGFSSEWYAVKKADVAYADAPSVLTYHVFLELFTEQGVLDKTKWVTFDSLKDPYTFATNATLAFKDAGWDKATLTYDGVWFSMDYTGSTLMNASAYVKDGKWTHVEDTAVYLDGETLCFAYGGFIDGTVYDTFSDSEKENWVYDSEYYGVKYYYTTVTEPIDGWKEKKDNTVLYIIIGAVAVVAVGLVAFFIFKKH